MNGLSLWPDLLCEVLRRVSVKDKRQNAQLVDKAWNRVLKQAAAPGTWGSVRVELVGLLGSLDPAGLYTADVSAVVSGSVAWLSFRSGAIDKLVLTVAPADGEKAAFYLQCYLPCLLGGLEASGKTPRLEILLSGYECGSWLGSSIFQQPALLALLAKDLSRLDLSWCLSLTPEQYTALEKLPGLQRLCISSCDRPGADPNLHQAMPAEFASLTELRSLIFEGPPYFSSIPPAFSQLSRHLTLTAIADAHFVPPPACLGQLTSLRTLALQSSMLDEFPFTGLAQLEHLDLCDNKLSHLPGHMSRLTSLRNLNLSNNQFTEFPESLARLSALERLCLQVNQIAELPASISGLSSLRHLDISKCRFVDFPDAALASLSSMVHLSLERQQDNGEPLAVKTPIHAFANMPDLAMVSLRQYFGDREAGLDDMLRFHLSNAEMRLRQEQARGERKAVPDLDYNRSSTHE